MQHMAHARCRECRCLWLTCDNSHLATQVNILGWTAGQAGGKARQMASLMSGTAEQQKVIHVACRMQCFIGTAPATPAQHAACQNSQNKTKGRVGCLT